MKQSPTDALYAYWTALRAEATAPRRFDIEPSRIAPLLPNTFILEKLGARDYRYRIAGTAICNLFGLELRDEPFSRGWTYADRTAIERTLAAVTCRGAVSRYAIDAHREPPADVQYQPRLRSTRERVTLRGILLPLVHTDGRMDRVLGALAVSETGEAPDWVGRDPLAMWRLSHLETEWPRPAPGRSSPFETARGILSGPRQRPSAFDDSVGPQKTSNDEAGSAQTSLQDRQSPFSTTIRRARIVRADRRQFRVYDGGLAGRTNGDDTVS